jgi:hypothetical protein
LWDNRVRITDGCRLEERREGLSVLLCGELGVVGGQQISAPSR